MPEPILISIAAAVAAKGAAGIYDLVKRKFAKDATSTKALKSAIAAPDDPQSVTALAERLQHAEANDQEFAEALLSEWHKLPAPSTAGANIYNKIVGDVTGKVVQARDVHGNISF